MSLMKFTLCHMQYLSYIYYETSKISAYQNGFMFYPV